MDDIVDAYLRHAYRLGQAVLCDAEFLHDLRQMFSPGVSVQGLSYAPSSVVVRDRHSSGARAVFGVNVNGFQIDAKYQAVSIFLPRRHVPQCVLVSVIGESATRCY